MLLTLKVKDLGIIEEMEWSLSPGLNVITGETGAGKSLVIDAVEALLRGKLDEEAIRHGANVSRIEGVFTPPQRRGLSELKEILSANGLESDEETLIINCEFRSQGRNIARVNGQAVPKGLLNRIGNLLVDIHGQSDHLSLLNKDYHLYFLDTYAHNLELRNLFTTKALELYRIEQELQALASKEKELAQREELLRFQIEEIRQAKLQEAEEEELEQERHILSAAAELKAVSYEAYRLLYGDEASVPQTPVVEKLDEAIQVMRRLVGLDSRLKPQLDFLEEATIGLKEVSRDIHSYGDHLEYDPQRLEEVEARLELIRTLKRKYGPSVTEILGYLKRVEKELAGFTNSLEQHAQLDERHSLLKREMGQIAFELSQARSRAAKKLAIKVKEELADLNMPQIEFEVSITQEPTEDGIPFPDGQHYSFNKFGVDFIEFMASTNIGEPAKPLTKIASTGETSRFMLALKGALSEADSTPVLIFDEIDVGVGGRSGEIIGKKLWALARSHQVVCVTHLPQIAPFGDAHYRVRKELSGSRTLSLLEPLKGESRTREIAAMLGGLRYSDTSLSNSLELIQKAEHWKESCQRGTKSSP